MEVTHVASHITHAVIGGGEHIEMGITDDAMFMHMLSSTLYSDKPLAVVREVLCNAWDAHKEAKRMDVPIIVSFEENMMSIKDNGFGIAKNMIGKIYGTYGKSTKKHDGTQTGGFGLGSKSPFAYIDHFEVTSCHAGIKTIYKMTKSSAEREGKSAIIPIVSVPTEEEGLTVKIEMLTHSDKVRFMDLVQRLTANGEMNVVMNGRKLDILPFSEMIYDYALTRAGVLQNHSAFCVRYGDVIYPLEKHNDFAAEYDSIAQILQTIANGRDSHRNRHGSPHTIILQAKPHTISITPSRESLSMERKTIDTVKGLLKKFLINHNAGFDPACKELVMKHVQTMAEKKQFAALLNEPTTVNIMADSQTAYNGKSFLVDTAQAAKQFLSHTYPDSYRFSVNDMLHRLTVLINSDSQYDKGMLQSFRTFYRKTTTKNGQHLHRYLGNKWYLQNVVAPILVPMKAEPELSKTRLYALAGTTMYNAEHLYLSEPLKYLQFSRKIVVLTHSAKDTERRIRGSGFTSEHGQPSGVLVYVVARTPKKTKAAREFFLKQDVILYDMTKVHEYQAPLARAEKPKAVKKVGHACLAVARTKDDTFSQDRAKNAVKEEHRVLKPEFYTYLHASSSRYKSTSKLPGFDNEEISKLICDVWGSKGAVIFTVLAETKMREAGIPELEVYISNKMNALLQSKRAMKHFGFAVNRFTAGLNYTSRTRQVIQMIWNSPAMRKHFKLGEHLTSEQQALMQIWAYTGDTLLNTKDFAKAVALIPDEPKGVELVKRIKASQTMCMLDLGALSSRIDSSNPIIQKSAINMLLRALKD